MRPLVGVSALALIGIALVGVAIAFFSPTGLLGKAPLVALARLLVWAARLVARWAFGPDGATNPP